MLKQVGANQALRFFATMDMKFEGDASTRSPVQPMNLSRESVFDLVSPSKAPHSTKKPFVWRKKSYFFFFLGSD
jgi:hypothetical protein